jgi:acyl-coenzyme A thioesterase PaaI-like protein
VQRTDSGALPPSFARVSLTLLAGQIHVNLLGDVHGGEMMRLVDSTAGAVAQRLGVLGAPSPVWRMWLVILVATTGHPSTA